MNRPGIEFGAGVFVLLGLAAMGWLTVAIGDIGVQDDHYTLTASFDSTSGLKRGAFVEIAGVRVGRVVDVTLDAAHYQSVVTLSVAEGIEVQEDAVASIRTSGIIGDKFIKLTPGGAPELLGPGGELLETEPSISLEELISKYIFSN